MKEKIRRFFAGRYGHDSLNRTLLFGALLLFIIYALTRWLAVYILSIPLFAVIFMRMFSRDTHRRARENLAFRRLIGKPMSFFKNLPGSVKKSRTHRFFRCPSCKKQLTVPKGKGNITITCPQCGAQFKGKT